MAGSKNLGKVGMTTGGEYSSSATYTKLTIVKHNGSQWISKTDVPSGNAPSADSTYWQLMHGTTDLKVLMTGDTASLDPNKVYVWEEAVTNLTITALNGGKEGRRNRYVFQFNNPKSAYTVLTLPSGVLWSSDTELDDNGVPVLDRNGCTRVEIVDNLATAKRWPSIYIIFEDPDVEALLMSKGVSSDGIGITRKDAREVSTIGTWFRGNTDITSFDELKYFTKVTQIATSAFRSMPLFRSINLSKITSIGTWAFADTPNIENIGYISQVTSIGEAAFRNCTKLSIDVNLPNVNGAIGRYTFQSTAIKTLCLPNVTSIAYEAFRNCTSLTSVILGNVTTIEQYVFSGCTALRTIYGLESVETMGVYCFYQCSSLACDIHLLNITTLASYSFRDSAITAMIAPVCTSINNEACLRCYSLKKVLIGNVTSIGSNAFYNCTSLEAFICKATTPPSLTSVQSLGNTNNCPIYVPDASVEAYKTATNWLNYATRIKGISDLQTDNPELYAEIAEYL